MNREHIILLSSVFLHMNQPLLFAPCSLFTWTLENRQLSVQPITEHTRGIRGNPQSTSPGPCVLSHDNIFHYRYIIDLYIINHLIILDSGPHDSGEWLVYYLTDFALSGTEPSSLHSFSSPDAVTSGTGSSWKHSHHGQPGFSAQRWGCGIEVWCHAVACISFIHLLVLNC